MAGIDGWLARKYQIQQEQADAGSRLQGAQAANITASTPSEIALRRAQAFQTNQQGLTTGPLSEASIAATRAGIGETQARAGLFGAQAQDIRANSLSPINDIGQSTIYRNMSQTYSPNVGAYSTSPDYTSTGGGLISGVPAGGLSSVPSPTPDITANRPSNYGVTEIGGTSSMDRNNERHYARGTPNVTQNRGVMAQTQNRGVPAYAFGTRNVATPPLRPAPTPVPETGTSGTPAGPGPGQTQTSGNWGTSGQNQNLRKLLGYAAGTDYVKGMDWGSQLPAFNYDRAIEGSYAKGTSKVAHHGGHRGGGGGPPMGVPGMMAPAMASSNAPAPVQAGPAMPGPQIAPPGGQPGLAAMLQAASGADRVPGQGDGRADTVPAMLAPGEAVLNRGAAENVGRDKIAKANAVGARKMGLNRGMVAKKPMGKNHVAVHVHMN